MPTPSRGALAQTAAVSVATILGSGILGLPVSLARSGLPPFLLSFTVTCAAQLAVVYATAELLQRASAAKRASAAHARRAPYRPLPYQAAAGVDDVEMPTSLWSVGDGEEGGAAAPGAARAGSGETSASSGTEWTMGSRLTPSGSAASVASVEGEELRAAERGSDAPGLHTFAELFLPYVWLKVLFELAVLFHFVSIMSSYALGAPQAFREVFPFLKVIPETVMVLVFTVGGALVITFLADAIVVPLTVATFIKGSLLTLMVCFVLAIGVGVGVRPVTDWGFAASVEPFLMGTLALSGVINLMPKLWDICIKSTGMTSKTAVDRDFVVSFRAAVNGAVVLCYVLNVMWCIGVLMVVPQGTTAADAASTNRHVSVALPYVARALTDGAVVANGTAAATLQGANDLGQISTVPLVEVLSGQEHGAAASAVINMVNVFIFISISVSFMVMGIGMTQMTDEMADSLVEWLHARRKAAGGAAVGRATAGARRAGRLLLAALFFTAISAISVANPKALLHIMAGFTSLALNLEGGVLIIIMFVVSRARGGAGQSPPAHGGSLDYVAPDGFYGIPAPVPRAAGWALVVFVLCFFSFAVGVDFVMYLPKLF